MASSLFVNPNPQSNVLGMLQQFAQFKQTMSGKDPQAIVQGMLESGQMTRQQFDQLSQMATQLQGILK